MRCIANELTDACEHSSLIQLLPCLTVSNSPHFLKRNCHDVTLPRPASLAHWDYRGQREASGQGLSCQPDEYYRQRPYAKTAEFEAVGGYLRSLTAKRELAGFFDARADYWWNAGFFRESVECRAWAAELDGFSAGLTMLNDSLNQWRQRLQPLLPSRNPKLKICFPPRRFSLIPERIEERIIELVCLEYILTNPDLEKQWWDPMRRIPNYLPPTMPQEIAFHVAPQQFNNRGLHRVRLPHV